MPEIAGDTDQGIFDAVKKYIEREWRVLPFNRGTGKCFLDNKTAAQFVCTTAEISAKFVGYDVGIGVRESGFVDLDIDCLRAVPFVDWLLPKTATIGRPGKLVSHLLFKRTGQIDTTHFTDIDGKEILAVLPNNRLALPPSRHKTGEVLTWQNDSEPAEIDAEYLTRAAGEIAALALITRHWPPPHARHEPTLALAGMLVRFGWPLEKAVDTVQLIGQITNDSKVDDRLTEVKSTYQRYKEGDKNISGLPKLAELLTVTGNDATALAGRLRKWLGPPEDEQTKTLGPSLSKYALTLPQLFALPVQDIEYLVDPFLPKSSLSMLFAERGVGKTWLTLHLALCLARGIDFFCWPVPKLRRVLVFDGEMPINYLSYRLRALLGGADSPPNLQIIPVAQMWLHNESLTINKPSDQERIEEYLATQEAKGERPDLIIFDNLSALMAGVDENSNSELDDFLPRQPAQAPRRRTRRRPGAARHGSPEPWSSTRVPNAAYGPCREDGRTLARRLPHRPLRRSKSTQLRPTDPHGR